jgi:hypothetical protein
MDPASRAVVVRMPLNKVPGPFNAAIRLRSAIEGDAEDGLGVARPAGLLGDPLIFRMTTPSSPRPAGSVQFRRTERIQVRWPVNGSIDSREARVLGRDGVPLELGPALSDREEDGIRFVVADLNLAPLTAGEYIIEVKATAAGKEDSAHLAIRVGR